MSAQWGRQVDHGGPVMSLQERVKELRKEHGWSQGELAERVGGDPAQISRYENGRITPSAEVVKLAEVFDVSTDYLLVEDSPRRPFRGAEDALGDRLGTIGTEPRGSDAAVGLPRRARHQEPAEGAGRWGQLTRPICSPTRPMAHAPGSTAESSGDHPAAPGRGVGSSASPGLSLLENCYNSGISRARNL